MGKDREGKFHPQKGKPSGEGSRTESPGLNSTAAGSFEEHLEIVEKYTVGEEEPAPNLRVRHPNRNVDKREERQQEKSEAKNTKAKRETMIEDVLGQAASTEEVSLPLTREKFNNLVNQQADLCISVFMATHSSGAEVNEPMDNTSFKSVLQQITTTLKQKNVDALKVEKILKPGYDLLRDDAFWLKQTKGLAFFITEEKFQYLRLPIEPKDEVVVNSSFYVSPLMPLIMNSDYFYLLVISKKRAKLFRADAFGMVELIIPELPNGVDDVVHFEEKEDQKLFRTGSSGGGGGASFHGHGAGKPDEKENIAMYFDEVDETLWKAILNKENVPLLLAGVDYLIPIYKSVAQYKPIYEDAITGGYEHLDMNSLYEMARAKMEPYFQTRHEKALELYANNSATELTSSIPADVIPSAYYKRVWHLFVQKGEHLWGTFDEMNNVLTLHETQEEGDEDQIDKAVTKTILNGGEVHVLPKEKMPADSLIAAVMRY